MRRQKSQLPISMTRLQITTTGKILRLGIGIEIDDLQNRKKRKKKRSSSNGYFEVILGIILSFL